MLGLMEAPLTIREQIRLLELAESAQNLTVRDHALSIIRQYNQTSSYQLTKEQAEALVKVGAVNK